MELPWQCKLAAKIVLSRLPLGYPAWRRLGLFRHGAIGDPAYALHVFRTHFDRVAFPRRDCGFVALELGPGDTLFSALIANAFGAAASYLVDVGPFARDDPAAYAAMIAHLQGPGLAPPLLDGGDLGGWGSLDELLRRCQARYLTGGLASLRTIPDRCVDFAWSQAVLEHVRKAEFLDTLHELRRILRDDGVCSHRIDLRDHLGGALNNLRFSERFWESALVAGSRFYTNRIRFSEMLHLFRQAGFDVQVLGVDRWPSLPTPRARLAAPFRHLPDDELCVSGFDAILVPAPRDREP